MPKSLEQIKKNAENPHIADENVIGALMRRMANLPICELFHPCFRQNLIASPWADIFEGIYQYLDGDVEKNTSFCETMSMMMDYINGQGDDFYTGNIDTPLAYLGELYVNYNS